MKEFLEKTLRQNVIMTENKEVYKKLPLAYRGRYDIFTVETNGVLWMAIHPKDDVGLVMLRRDRAGVEKMTGLNCAIFLDRTTFYIKEKMMEEGIPFVIEGKQVFLPFIGYLLSKENERELAPVHLISFLTQKMLLMAIYERWNEVKVSDAAKRIGVSTKSASRCFDELEYLNIDVLGMKGKSRVINIPDDRKQLWQQIERVLRNPVIRRFVLREDMKIEKSEKMLLMEFQPKLVVKNYSFEIKVKGLKNVASIICNVDGMKALILLGFLDGSVEFTPYLHLWKIGSV